MRFLTTGCMLLVLAGFLAAAVSKTPATAQDRPAVDWSPIDSINADLPDGVRAYAGVDDDKPLRAWHVRIDDPEAAAPARVAVARNEERLKTTSDFAEERDACVAVNAGYFALDESPSQSVGLLQTADTLWGAPTTTLERDDQTFHTARAALGIRADGTLKVDWVATDDEQLEAWKRPPAHQPDKPADPPDDAYVRPWEVKDAVGAGPMLVRSDSAFVADDEEVFFGTSIPETHPRTAAGITDDGALVLMVVDGRQPESAGVDLDDLAALMQSVGARDALNLDGGGSSTLVVNGTLLNRPMGDTTERPVHSALIAQCENTTNASQQAALSTPINAQPDTLDERIQAILDEYPEATVGIAIRDPATGMQYDHQAERSFHAASTMKVPVMIEAFRRAEQDDFSLADEIRLENAFASIVDGSTYAIDSDSDAAIYEHLGETMTIEHLTERMIQISSNLATNLLIEHLTPDSIQQTVDRLGASGMQVKRGVFDMPAFYEDINNTTTAAALATQLEALMQREAVSPEADRAMIDILRDQEFVDAIPAGLPEGVAVAHKTGSITEIHHDAAIVDPSDGAPYVIVLLIEGIESDDDSAALMAAITQAVHDHLRGHE